ncbi:MAG: hypothetical protein RDV41_00435 [Planctomycetota bacterium]|nr:hypothetical protein [Planctomycetota bacterium]
MAGFRFQFLCAILALCAVACAAATEELSVSVSSAAVVEKEGTTSFAVECKGNLPDATLLEAEVFFLKPRLLPPALQQRMGMKFEVMKVSVGKSLERMRGGRASFVLGFMQRRPFCGKYCARVRCQERNQDDETLNKIGGSLPLEAQTEFEFGSAEELENQAAEARQLLRDDLVELTRLLKRLDGLFASFLSTQTGIVRREPLTKAQSEEWLAGLVGWRKDASVLEMKNEKRPEVEVFWAEFMGKKTISSRLDSIKQLADEYDRVLGKLPVPPEKHQELLAASTELMQLFEMDLEYFGFGKQLDTKALEAEIAGLEAGFRGLVEWALAAPAEGRQAQREAWRERGEHLFAVFAEKSIGVLEKLQGVSLRNVLALTNLSAKIRDLAVAGGDVTAEIGKLGADGAKKIEMIRKDIAAEPER